MPALCYPSRESKVGSASCPSCPALRMPQAGALTFDRKGNPTPPPPPKLNCWSAPERLTKRQSEAEDLHRWDLHRCVRSHLSLSELILSSSPVSASHNGQSLWEKLMDECGFQKDTIQGVSLTQHWQWSKCDTNQRRKGKQDWKAVRRAQRWMEGGSPVTTAKAHTYSLPRVLRIKWYGVWCTWNKCSKWSLIPPGSVTMGTRFSKLYYPISCSLYHMPHLILVTVPCFSAALEGDSPFGLGLRSNANSLIISKPSFSSQSQAKTSAASTT